MELTYTEGKDGMLYPNLLLPEEGEVFLGKYALMRKSYLQKHRRILFVNLLTGGTLNQHLMEVEQTANARMETMVRQMAQAQGVTEELKAQDQMRWVGMMNNIRHCAEEVVLSEIVYE